MYYSSCFFLFRVASTGKGKHLPGPKPGDSIQYLIIDAGSGKHITNKIAQLVKMHERKGDSCRVIYLSDSNAILKEQEHFVVQFRIARSEG